MQRKIDAILARFAGDYLALPEGSRWAVACACEFARGAVGRSRTSAEAVAVLSAKVVT